MSRYIDANALREKWLCLQGHDFSPSSFVYSIDNATTIDAVPVVRCGECKYCIEVFHQTEEGIYPLKNICHKGHGFGSVKDDWFCADGERKEDKRCH